MKQVKRLCLFMSFTFLFSQCKKNHFKKLVPLQPSKTIDASQGKALQLKTVVLLLEAGKDPDFKNLVFEECLKQEHGDYNVYLEKLITIASVNPKFNSILSELSPLVKELRKIYGSEPILFFPNAETIEEESSSKEPINANRMEPDIYGVTSSEYNEVTTLAPAYTLATDNTLTYYGNINEDFAWENDVWVIGQEENCSPGNMIAETENTLINPLRNQGEAEYGGIIQVTNLGDLEPWICGKFEFRYLVFNAGGIIIKDRKFGKTKRKYFRDMKIHDYNDFIANWNTSTIGNWMIEAWVEEDGGDKTSTISQNFPAPCSGCPTTNVSYTTKKSDNDMGRTMVQFTDAKSQWYNIRSANIKRK